MFPSGCNPFCILIINNSIMQKSILFLAVVVSTFTNLNSQINWSEYNDPDGSLARMYISPLMNLNSNSSGFINGQDQTNLNLGLNANYQLTSIKELTTASIFITIAPYYSYENLDSESNSKFVYDQNVFGRYSKYLKTRRSWYIETQGSLNLDYDSSLPNDKYDDNYHAGLYFGKGRLEDMSSVYQTIRINNQYYKVDTEILILEQEQLFSIAQQIRQLDYNNKLDSRYRSIENQAEFLKILDEAGYQLDNYYSIANMIDAFKFERTSSLSHGNQFSLGVEYRKFGSFKQTWLVGNLFVNRAINSKWHIANSLMMNYIIDPEQFVISANTSLSYIPSGRTQIRFSFQPFYNTSGDILNLRFDNSVQYFVSPQMSISGSLILRAFSLLNDFSSSSIGANFGFRYYIF